DGAKFFADPNNPATLLTSAPPTAFGFLGPTAPILIGDAVLGGPILQVPDGQTLSFVGGDVQIANSTLVAPSGRVQIGSFASAGEASIDGLNGDFAALGNIGVSTSTISAGDVNGFGGGNVILRGGQIDITASLIDVSGDFFSSSGGSVM